MFIVTGGAGFIGSVLVWKLNQLGIDDIVIVDRLGSGAKWQNLVKRKFRRLLHKDEFHGWLRGEGARSMIDAVFHMGASSATTESDVDYLVRNNLNYSVALWDFCRENGVPFIYASSASTYGGGERGFSDADAKVAELRPQHPYGFSKQKFDQWALAQEAAPPRWAGLKFFNVYGPQEYHKGAQASVVHHWVPQIQATGRVRLFKSAKAGIADGEQKRDFVYVKDVVDVAWHCYRDHRNARSGIYNVGTGAARTFLDLARATLAAMGKSPDAVDFFPMPEHLRSQYQYFTEADLTKLRAHAAYDRPFTTLEAGVDEYVRCFLAGEDPYL